MLFLFFIILYLCDDDKLNDILGTFRGSMCHNTSRGYPWVVIGIKGSINIKMKDIQHSSNHNGRNLLLISSLKCIISVLLPST